MTAGPLLTAADWKSVRLVAFDVDGTLYRQRPLRLQMAFELLMYALRKRDLLTPRVLRNYRRIRDRLGEQEAVDFMRPLLAETASACGTSEDQVRSIVAEWIERRPLRHLARCRYCGLVELFTALRRKGMSIGVLSDYAATAKLRALDLEVDYVVCAEDSGIGMLKPNPKGLVALIGAADATPETTVLIGDRPERDGLAARRIGARALIRSSRPIDNWQTFRRFDNGPFLPIIAG